MKTNKNFKAIIFGILFGFLLHKGGVTKYHILEGQLLLQDFTVMKVILSSIAVGMIGFMILHKSGKVELQIKPAQLASNITGGLIFGVGFAFAGYCPGTGAAALGQGDLGALYYIGGMIVGSYFYAEASKKISQTIQKVWNKGQLTLPEALNVQRIKFVASTATVIMVFFLIINYYEKNHK